MPTEHATMSEGEVSGTPSKNLQGGHKHLVREKESERERERERGRGGGGEGEGEGE